MRVLILDNYDSFTFNLAQYLGELGAEPRVVRSDVVPASEAAGWDVDRLVISPGPGRPENAGFSIDYVKTFSERVPTLGVCLGHQAVGVAFGGEVGPAPEPRHGKTSPIRHDRRGVFGGCENPFTATRYHSLAITTLPPRPGSLRVERGRGDPGGAPSVPTRDRRAVPPREHPHHRGEETAGQLSRPGRDMSEPACWGGGSRGYSLVLQEVVHADR